MSCATEICVTNINLTFLPTDDYIMCTKRCYEKVMKQIKDKEIEVDVAAQLPWEKYRPGGPGNENNSLQVLMNWWTTPGQYAKYRGKGNKGLKKLAICGF